MLENFFEALYNKVIVSIVLKHASCDVYVEICSRTTVVESVQESFATTTLNEMMVDFINSYTKESPYFYIAILDMSNEQGVIPTCSKNKLSYYSDLSAAEYKCYKDRWIYYTSKSDLYEIEKSYQQIGVDYIFSPFTLLYNFFKDKINTHMALYILVQDSCISLFIFENSQLLYGEHLDLQTASEEDELLTQEIEEEDDIDLSEDSSISLEDVDAMDVMEDLDDFSDIEDLDSIEEIDEFSESQDIEEEFYEAQEEKIVADESSFNEDYQRFTLIQSSLGHYYNDSKYESKFVENVYIADGVGVSSDLKRYIEEEMFLNVYIRHFDIAMEVCNLTKEELDYEV